MWMTPFNTPGFWNTASQVKYNNHYKCFIRASYSPALTTRKCCNLQFSTFSVNPISEISSITWRITGINTEFYLQIFHSKSKYMMKTLNEWNLHLRSSALSHLVGFGDSFQGLSRRSFRNLRQNPGEFMWHTSSHRDLCDLHTVLLLPGSWIWTGWPSAGRPSARQRSEVQGLQRHTFSYFKFYVFGCINVCRQHLRNHFTP